MEGEQDPCGMDIMIGTVSQQEGSERRPWVCSGGNRRTCGPTRRSTKGQWTTDEDEILRKAVEQFQGKSWKKIAECFKNRTDVQCLHRWQKVLNPELIKGPWAKEEDEIIIESVKRYGATKWSAIAKHLPGRIGKQCRERWHNHLNPAINKEAWTQEEELALISAHQTYGNKWAELTKFLPGRTDNAIKNHWNSCVKKRLDSYIVPGLLSKHQGSFLCLKKNLPMQSSSSSSRRQCSGDDNLCSDVMGAEENSECSQNSSLRGYRQQGSDNSNSAVCKTDCDLAAEDFCHSPNSGPSQNIGPITEDKNINIPSLTGSHSIHSLSNCTEPPTNRCCQPRFPEILSIKLGEESATATHSQASNDNQMLITLPNQMQFSVGDSIMDTERILMSEVGTLQVGELDSGACCPSGFMSKCSDATESVDRSVISERSGVVLSRADDITGDCTLVFNAKSNQLDVHAFGNPEQEINRRPPHDTIQSDNQVDNSDVLSLKGKEEYVANYSVSVPTNMSYNMEGCCKDDGEVQNYETEDGGLFYEPPQFPSIEIPFFSCNLIQSGSDTQQEFSPLGIRQLMISSVNCLTPFRLSDSPPRGGSPDVMLKSSTKSFSNTPSILKKRRHEFFSSLNQRREKRMVNEISKELSACNLDLEFEKSSSHRFRTRKIDEESVLYKKMEKWCENQENICPKENKEKKPFAPVNSCDGLVKCGKASEGESDDTFKSNPTVGRTTEELRDPDLVGGKANFKPFISPDRNGFAGEYASIVSARGQINDSRNPDTAVDPIFSSGSRFKNRISVISPRLPCDATCTEADVTAEMKTDIFCGTPFKRGIESPSAWKSPWFINHCFPRMYGMESLSLEDVGYFTSPGERRYDAIGLMKQLSEHTALTFANAQAVLESENENDDRPSHHFNKTSASTEPRILDFSD